uniref:Uncharacterized protein n=1 Tax=Anopheles quadriannulatus TaxID=34691 RepID=A0A182XQD4_ANOQN
MKLLAVVLLVLGVTLCWGKPAPQEAMPVEMVAAAAAADA